MLSRDISIREIQVKFLTSGIDSKVRACIRCFGHPIDLVTFMKRVKLIETETHRYILSHEKLETSHFSQKKQELRDTPERKWLLKLKVSNSFSLLKKGLPKKWLRRKREKIDVWNRWLNCVAILKGRVWRDSFLHFKGQRRSPSWDREIQVWEGEAVRRARGKVCRS